MCAPTVPISKQDSPGLRLLGGQSDLSSYRGRLLGRPRGDQEEGSRARTTQALELLLGKLGSATTVGGQRLPWWYLPEITARCASCWEPRGDVLMGAGEKAMRRGEVGDELLELSSLICAAEMFGTSCRSYWWTKIKIWKHHYLQARQLRVARRL